MSKDLTVTVCQAASGDRHAADELVGCVYKELRKLAGNLLANERVDHTLQATALVHEAYLRLVRSPLTLEGRTHFFRVAAKTMRQVLVDYARSRNAEKRGGGRICLQITDLAVEPERSHFGVLAVEELIESLTKANERWGRIAELLVYGDLNVKEVARELKVTPRTVERDLEWIRAWLRNRLLEGAR